MAREREEAARAGVWAALKPCEGAIVRSLAHLGFVAIEVTRTPTGIAFLVSGIETLQDGGSSIPKRSFVRHSRERP